MSTIYAIMNTAKWALLTHQKSLQVASHNIANVGTPGFSRQEVILETATPLSSNPGQIGTGVRAEEVRRVYDRFLQSQLAKESQILGRWQARKGAVGQVAAIFDETSETGLSARMTEFWNAWQELANNPSGQAERTDLVLKATSMAEMFNRAYSNLSDLRDQMDDLVSDGLDTVNTISTQIANLNEKIASVEVTGQNANDYRDQRDQLLKDLSEMIDFNSFESSDGMVTVFVAGGKPIVQGKISFSLQGETNSSGFYDVMWNDGKDNLTDITSKIEQGKLGAWLEMRDDTIAGYIDQLNTLAQSMIGEVNRLHSSGVGLSYHTSLTTSYEADPAASLASSASGLPFWDEIVEGNGFSLWVYNTATQGETETSITVDPGDTLQDLGQKVDAVTGVSATVSGGYMTISADSGYEFHFSDDQSDVLMALGLNGFFDGTGASDMAVNSVIQNDVSKIAAATDHRALPGDNRNALAIADLQNANLLAGNTATFDGYYNSLVGSVGASLSDAKTATDHQESMVEHIENRREEVSGVSLDEEMTNLMEFQQAYEASAQMIRVVGEMLDTVMSLV
ncbi:MAG: flagellar hook-associated protein FlgK [Deltaproteobacteria bacterium]|nr:flagellar hook-associated protein FlgK [Deltaproteobacteria bacterium]